MQRRTILAWLSGALAAVSTALIGIPGVGFVVELVRRGSSNKSLVQRVIRLRDLPPGKAVLIPVIGTRQDAWTTYPSETIGRVWLVRGTGKDSSQNTRVDAFTATCPHLGCQIQQDAKQGGFVCPCHKAAFSQDGKPISERQLGHRNHAPRAMDSLECQVVKDEDSDEWWVELKYEQFEQGLTKKVVKS